MYPIIRRLILLGTPLVLGVLELWHPRTLTSGNVGWWITLHIVQIPLFGLLALAISYLLGYQSGPLTLLSRICAWLFALFYVAFDAVAGIATGILVASAPETPAIQVLSNGESTHLLLEIGRSCWLVAILTVVLVLLRVRRPFPPLLLLLLAALSFWYSHQPAAFLGLVLPFGTLAMACFFAAAVWLEMIPPPTFDAGTGRRIF
jgi:hypothetical protein